MPSKTKKASTQVHGAQTQPLNNTSQHAMPPAPAAKMAGPVPSSVPSANGEVSSSKAESDAKTGDTTESAGERTLTPALNRKKQKRREKEAAKRAAAEQEPLNGHASDSSRPNGQISAIKPGRGPAKGYFTEETDYVGNSHPPEEDPAALGDHPGSPEDAFYSGDDDPGYADGAAAPPDSSWLNTSRRKKGSKSKKSGASQSNSVSQVPPPVLARSNLPALSNAAIRASHKMSNDQIWNTSTQAERENIKQFWLELGEDERRSLVKVEKEAVLRKMKEQQKHSCSCSVCGRKRTAIEEELEVLYDAYYEELEQFANNNNDLPNPSPMIASSRHPLKRITHPMAGSYPSRGRVHEIGEEDEDFDEDEEEEYEEDDEPYSEDEEELDSHSHGHGLPPGPPDFFQFGNSLTVKDGILTVADDLLKNDGKHFIDMMEQLAERRMQREEEIRYPSSALAHRDIHEGHNHPPIDEDDDYDDEEDDDEDYDSQEEDEFEGDEMDSMTEEQRMEEGRRMFQIFAARMFEQRVLTAYREKVAAERQQKLLEELEEESRLDSQREAKKAKEAAKKKEKKRLQKLAKEEERAKKEAEKAAEEAAARALEEKRLEEQRQRKEEQRKKREAERKAAEEERLRKEAEKQRRAQQERERQAEAERRRREAQERERQRREEARKKEREEREARDKERKSKEDKEKRAREEQARKEKEASSKAEKEGRDRAGPNQALKQQPVALPPGLHPPSRGSQIQSPHFQVATPIIPPKVPTPGRNRQTSQPGLQSHASSPRSQKATSTDISLTSASPATVAIPQTPALTQQPAKAQGQPPMLHHPQPSAPRSPLNHHGRGQYAFTMNGLPGLGVSGPPLGAPGMMSTMMPPMPMYQGPPPVGSQPRYASNGMQYPPGFGGPRAFQGAHPMPFASQPPAPGAIPTSQAPASQGPIHSRQPSLSNNAETIQPPAPIARPGPIARPSSTTSDKQKPPRELLGEIDQITTQLGSKALLDDSDEPFLGGPAEPRMGLPPVGAPGSNRGPFASSFAEPKHESFAMGNPSWGAFNNGISAAPGWGPPGSQRPSPGWSQPPFGAIGGGPQPIQRSHLPRPIAVRLMLVQACRHLSAVPSASADGYHPVQAVLRQLEALKSPGEPPVSMDEMLGICDTEGNSQNGGGSFEVVIDSARGQVVKFVEDTSVQPRSSVGDIGSPIPGHIQPSPFSGVASFGPPGRSF